MLRLALQLHKWIALVVGIQVLGWVLGGLIMTALPIQQVRGEQHIAAVEAKPLELTKVLSLAEAAKRSGISNITQATLKTTPRGPIWDLNEAYFDAYSGENVDEITAAAARAYALAAYKGPGHPAKITHYDEAPTETGVSGTVWRVEFDDTEKTSLYLSAYTGEVLSRRSNLWRFYNFFYQIHIMNFSGAQNYNHPTIVAVTALTLTVVLTGFVLLWIRIARDLKNLSAAKRGEAQVS